MRAHRSIGICVLLAVCASLTHATPSPQSLRDEALDRTLSALWQALSNEPGAAADSATLRALFHPQAHILGASDRGLRVQSVDDFIAPFARPDRNGFHEREIWRRIDIVGDLAHVFSTVESRSERDEAQPDAIGVNSLQLHWNGEHWQIVSLYYQLETQLAPIPDRYRAK